MEFDVEKMSKALAECNGGHCPYGCYLFNTAIKDEAMQSRNCLNIANEVIKKLTEQIFKLENRLKECENGYEGTLFLESCKLHDAEEKVKELTEENERLTRRLEKEAKCQYDLCGQIVDLKAENERLKSVEFTCGFVKPHKVLECPIFDEIEKAKADTVRELAEKVNSCFCPDCDYSGYEIREVIDQIAKEAEEEG